MVEFSICMDRDTMHWERMRPIESQERLVMQTPQDVKSIESGEEDPPEGGQPDNRHPAGRIIHDERGNAMWKWRGDSSSTGTGSGILKHLDPRDLCVEGQENTAVDSNKLRPRISDTGGGYDPYDQSPKRRR